MKPRSEDTVFVVSASACDAERISASLRERGWSVETEAQNPADACWRIGECRPHAVVISLDNDASIGCDLACALTVAEVTSDIPVLFVGGTSEDLTVISERHPDAIFVDDADIPLVLKRILYRQ